MPLDDVLAPALVRRAATDHLSTVRLAGLRVRTLSALPPLADLAGATPERVLPAATALVDERSGAHDLHRLRRTGWIHLLPTTPPALVRTGLDPAQPDAGTHFGPLAARLASTLQALTNEPRLVRQLGDVRWSPQVVELPGCRLTFLHLGGRTRETWWIVLASAGRIDDDVSLLSVDEAERLVREAEDVFTLPSERREEPLLG